MLRLAASVVSGILGLALLFSGYYLTGVVFLAAALIFYVDYAQRKKQAGRDVLVIDQAWDRYHGEQKAAAWERAVRDFPQGTPAYKRYYYLAKAAYARQEYDKAREYFQQSHREAAAAGAWDFYQSITLEMLRQSTGKKKQAQAAGFLFLFFALPVLLSMFLGLLGLIIGAILIVVVIVLIYAVAFFGNRKLKIFNFRIGWD